MSPPAFLNKRIGEHLSTDGSIHELSRRSTDARQFAYLKRPEVTSVINEAVGECAGILRKSVDEYQQLETQFAEPELFARIFIVFHHSGERLGLF